ncbi:MAG: 4-hydroxy-tetrahydrodipicolinate reductase [Flavobacteriales bacterium]|nr:4-hydroxy-tetrahydrodipicolinate reductase [Flavobacteriales bacterium]
MRIGLWGYGKMGHEIEKQALQRGHEIIWKLDEQNVSSFSDEDLKSADVAIEFTAPHAAVHNILRAFKINLPIVVGTTGWYAHLNEIKKQCEEGNHSLIYGSNFSVGVNILFAVNTYLARIMNRYPQYNPQITEIHHTQKLDAPSGTAITLAEAIIQANDQKAYWVNHVAVEPEQLGIISVREDAVPGTHHVTYESPIDKIELIHTAYNRQGFALGAVMAAEWLLGKKGFFEVKQMFHFS